ncbi:hypothetical protein [Oceanibaculum indicum]|uniref:Uncharacterized protein n=1 Tax=Oceanibaculum indicum TaxID=526216 RepID=A0A420WPY7_9PROT|nr:hypothetical protein [Oceanibaculum indicum]RKQ73111.1 hypothetical protein BCL74_0884 [Oceanibaculum indicum]
MYAEIALDAVRRKEAGDSRTIPEIYAYLLEQLAPLLPAAPEPSPSDVVRASVVTRLDGTVFTEVKTRGDMEGAE